MKLIGQSNDIAAMPNSTTFTVTVSGSYFITRCFRSADDSEVFPIIRSSYTETETEFELIFEHNEIVAGEKFYIQCYSL